MASNSESAPLLARPDTRPIVVTLVAVGFLLICGLGGLNALVVLVNGSTRIELVEYPPHEQLDAYDFDDSPPADSLGPRLLVLDRIFGAAYVAIATLGMTGAIGLLRRRPWSRVALWATAGGAVGAHAAYTLYRLQIQTGEITDLLDRQEAFELVAATSLINVAIQSIPIALLAGLLRHTAVRQYLLEAPDA